MNEANICHICQLKDEKEGEKVKNRAILIKSDRLLASLIKLVLIFLFVPSLLVIIDNLDLGIKPAEHVSAEFGHPDLSGLFTLKIVEYHTFGKDSGLGLLPHDLLKKEGKQIVLKPAGPIIESRSCCSKDL